MPNSEPILHAIQTFFHYASCRTFFKPVRHSANPPPLTQEELEAQRAAAKPPVPDAARARRAHARERQGQLE
jgi:hypothetical protein